MPKLNGGEALIQSLYRQGIRTVFGIPGLGQYEAVDALYSTPAIRYISVRNEQAASYMADGYARASGEIAAALVVPGPGVLNATAGMATAFAASSPMLVITGTDHQREGWDDDRDPPLLHALTKWTGRAGSVEEIPTLVHTALQELRQGRPRPVALEIPQEILAARAAVQWTDPVSPVKPGADPALLARAIEWMRTATRPLIWAGGGVHIAGVASPDPNTNQSPLEALAEAWGAPVMASRSGKGALSDRHPLSLGYGELRYPPLRRRFEESDVILAIGASMDFSAHPGKVIHVNIDPAHAPGDAADRLGLVGDAKTVLTQLLTQAERFDPQLTGPQKDRNALHEQIAALNAARFADAEQLQPQADIMRAIRNALPHDAILTTDMTQMGYYSRNYYPVYAARAYFTCTRLWTLGAAFPMALGAAVAQSKMEQTGAYQTDSAQADVPAVKRPVVALMGDGGFLYNAQELATAVKYDLPVVVVLFNDHAYGNVLRAQQEEFDGHVLGTRLCNPDFIQLAQSYGIWNRRVDSASALEDALCQAINLRKPALIEMPVGPMQRKY